MNISKCLLRQNGTVLDKSAEVDHVQGLGRCQECCQKHSVRTMEWNFKLVLVLALAFTLMLVPALGWSFSKPDILSSDIIGRCSVRVHPLERGEGRRTQVPTRRGGNERRSRWNVAGDRALQASSTWRKCCRQLRQRSIVLGEAWLDNYRTCLPMTNHCSLFSKCHSAFS